MPDKEKQVVFCLSQYPDGTPLVILGITRASFNEMLKDKTSESDFTQMGVPVRMLMFARETRGQIMETITMVQKLKQPNAALDIDYNKDMRTPKICAHVLTPGVLCGKTQLRTPSGTLICPDGHMEEPQG
jgi:hypothetical protein